jgi:hypothetical protein
MSTALAQAAIYGEINLFPRCERCSARMKSSDSKVCRECAARSSQLVGQVDDVIGMRQRIVELEAENNRLEAENLLLGEKLARADVLAVQLKGVLGG